MVQKTQRPKDALLRLLLERVTIRHNTETIRVELTWRHGRVKDELLIKRPYKKERQCWTDAELEVLKNHYAAASQDELMEMLPDRTWGAIAAKGTRLGLSRVGIQGVGGSEFAYTPEEDELVQRYYADEIDLREAMSTGRSAVSIRKRAKRLGIKRQREVTWGWVSLNTQADNSSR